MEGPPKQCVFSARNTCNLLHMSRALPENPHTISAHKFSESFWGPSASKKHYKQKKQKIITDRTYTYNFFSMALARETACDWLIIVHSVLNIKLICENHDVIACVHSPSYYKCKTKRIMSVARPIGQ